MMRKTTFQVDGLALEGVLHGVENARGAPVPAAVVCHPHPLYGGDMHNAVVVAVCDALSKQGISALRFNFRGVGGSQGSHGGGRDERNDVRAALAFLASQADINPRRLCLAGYSFGALVALSTRYSALAAMAVISPPLTGNPDEAFRLSCPTLFVFGERDSVAPSTGVEAIDLPPGSRIAVVPGADHFWCGQEEEAAAEVAAFFSERARL
jgi:hypothetical protein